MTLLIILCIRCHRVSIPHLVLASVGWLMIAACHGATSVKERVPLSIEVEVGVVVHQVEASLVHKLFVLAGMDRVRKALSLSHELRILQVLATHLIVDCLQICIDIVSIVLPGFLSKALLLWEVWCAFLRLGKHNVRLVFFRNVLSLCLRLGL